MTPRPIWEIFPYMCGNGLRRRLILTLKAYADESGKGDSPGFVMAGFIARADQWPSFEDDWNAVLAIPPALEYFHMVDAVAAKDFDRIRRMSAVIKKHQFMALVVTVFMRDYGWIIRGRIGPRFDSPYFLALVSFMGLAVTWEIQNGLDEPIDFIFDEQKGESDFLQSIWTPFSNGFPDEIKRRFGQRPVHLDDKKTPALQAADMLAWSMRRITDKITKNEPIDDFLADSFEGVPMRQDNWGADRMVAFYESMRVRNQSEGRVSAHLFAAVAQNKDGLYSELNRKAIERASPGATVPLLSIPASGIGRFLLIDKCPRSDTRHLHRRSGDQCLAELGT